MSRAALLALGALAGCASLVDSADRYPGRPEVAARYLALASLEAPEDDALRDRARATADRAVAGLDEAIDRAEADPGRALALGLYRNAVAAELSSSGLDRRWLARDLGPLIARARGTAVAALDEAEVGGRPLAERLRRATAAAALDPDDPELALRADRLTARASRPVAIEAAGGGALALGLARRIERALGRIRSPWFHLVRADGRPELVLRVSAATEVSDTGWEELERGEALAYVRAKDRFGADIAIGEDRFARREVRAEFEVWTRETSAAVEAAVALVQLAEPGGEQLRLAPARERRDRRTRIVVAGDRRAFSPMTLDDAGAAVENPFARLAAFDSSDWPPTSPERLTAALVDELAEELGAAVARALTSEPPASAPVVVGRLEPPQ